MSLGFFGKYGGRYVPETLIPALQEVDAAFRQARSSADFKKDLNRLLTDFVGRETPLYFARRLSEEYNARIYLKREDLCHTGAHKINNTVGQGLLAQRLGKTRLIAETGAGQHGVATATVAAHLGFECVVFMGEEDMLRQKPNVDRMHLLGARVVCVRSGSRTLKDAINEALRHWTLTVKNTHYLFGSVLGPHPFPTLVRYFQGVIGKETRRQIRKAEGRDPDFIIACVGGGSNAIGIFQTFLNNPAVTLIGVEAGGRGKALGEHAARFLKPTVGVFHGTCSYVLQNRGQIQTTHSISAGLDYPGIGPEHAALYDAGRVEYPRIGDQEALRGFQKLASVEGIIPALESAHAVAYLEKMKSRIQGKVVVVNLSGRGDKDLDTVMAALSSGGKRP